MRRSGRWQVRASRGARDPALHGSAQPPARGDGSPPRTHPGVSPNILSGDETTPNAGIPHGDDVGNTIAQHCVVPATIHGGGINRTPSAPTGMALRYRKLPQGEVILPSHRLRPTRYSTLRMQVTTKDVLRNASQGQMVTQVPIASQPGMVLSQGHLALMKLATLFYRVRRQTSPTSHRGMTTGRHDRKWTLVRRKTPRSEVKYE